MGTGVTRRCRSLVVLVAAVAVLLSGCSFVGAAPDGGAADSERITLRVNVFGRFGYADVYRKYEQRHPNVKIVESAESDLGRYNQQIVARIAAGNGAGDIVAIEEGQLAQFLETPDSFVNLLDHRGGKLRDNFLPWKYEQALTRDKKHLIGLGTDIGGLAMCYRRDLFKRAGLPTERDEVAKLWPTWEGYIETGKRFRAGIGNDRIRFLDAATNTYNGMLMQAGDITYFDRSNNLVIDDNRAVKQAWDTAMAMIEAGLSANLRAFSAEWNAGVKHDAFATVICPAWLTGYIKGQAGPAFAGKWDIARVPGGPGSWGGSFLAVPAQSKNRDEAVELLKFLTGPEGQLAAFQAEGNLPSSPTLYETASVRKARSAYFNDAPIGQLFVAGARSLEPIYLGKEHQSVRDTVENAMRGVEQGQAKPSQAWSIAIEGARQAVG